MTNKIEYKCTTCGKTVNDAYLTDYGEFCSKSCQKEFEDRHNKPNIIK